ncbi:MAG: carboxypeptidase regulatory-like domain-containing protein [Candidatus Coatesbacteria bacterium]|nr:MAG: carboxypeptidase regulatory-like domain-containing protein [Candidatus Coatesbacteria bacterium]
MLRDIPRGIEVLVKKAAVDPSFKKLLLQRRAEAAEAIALTLSPAEEAMLAAVPEAQLRAIVASTKVSPSLRPAFLGYAAAAMLAALGISTTRATAGHKAEQEIITSTGIRSETGEGKTEIARIVLDYYGVELSDDAGIVAGKVIDQNGQTVSGALLTIMDTNLYGNSNSDGVFYIEKVPPGKYKVLCSRIGFKENNYKVEVQAGTFQELTIVLITEATGGIRPDRP